LKGRSVGWHVSASDLSGVGQQGLRVACLVAEGLKDVKKFAENRNFGSGRHRHSCCA